MDRKAGRPTRDPKGGSSKIVPVRMTDDERTQFQRAAKRAKMTLSGWIRDRLARAAKREAKKP